MTGQADSHAEVAAAAEGSALGPTGVPVADFERILDVKVNVTVELGRREMPLAEVMQLKPHSTIEFFKKSDEPLDILINGRIIARGEVVVMGDRYGVRLTEVVNSQRVSGKVDMGAYEK